MFVLGGEGVGGAYYAPRLRRDGHKKGLSFLQKTCIMVEE